jgi:nitrogen fixation NifU-like protein
MSGLEDLYREIILDHYKSPRNQGRLESPPATLEEGFNPLCGDEITVSVLLEDEIVTDVKIDGQGCSISKSSASLMSAAVKGKSLRQIATIVRTFKSMMSIPEDEAIPFVGPDDPSNASDPPILSEAEMGELIALQGVVKFPVRIKCATLAWNTFSLALKKAQDAKIAPSEAP